MKRIKSVLLAALLMAGCASVSRDCTSCQASNFGADWLIVQYKADGTPIECWEAKNVALSSEEHSDGIFWKMNGHMVHLGGWYNHVQVEDGDFVSAKKMLGISDRECIVGGQ